MSMTRGHRAGPRFTDEDRHRGAVPNGYGAARASAKIIGPVSADGNRSASTILPAWARSSPQLGEVLSLLYLHGMQGADLASALGQVLGSDLGLSTTMITGLMTQWQEDARVFQNRTLAGVDYVYVWVDGIELKVRLEQDKLCLLAMVGVRSDGRKELIALAEGFADSVESWVDLLGDCRRRGMTAPVLVIGDTDLGIWKAVGAVFPQAEQQRCWPHTSIDVLTALPTNVRPAALKALHRIAGAADRSHAVAAARSFADAYATQWPDAAAKIIDDLDALLAFYHYPVEHWVQLRTTNPIESTFATVRLRNRVVNGPGSRAAGIAMAHKLIDSAQYRWPAISAPHLVPPVRADAEPENTGRAPWLRP
ncbi:MAG: IS256 family transposase [Microlunatus sp.]|nr:IS256 family transposase [Microlunatus sp.]